MRWKVFLAVNENSTATRILLTFLVEENHTTTLPVRAAVSLAPHGLLLKRINEKTNECQHQHQHCRKDETVLPTRVINVGDDGDNPALRITAPFEKGSYVALSYCWGYQQDVITTFESLPYMARGFPITSLPPTIRDAIT